MDTSAAGLFFIRISVRVKLMFGSASRVRFEVGIPISSMGVSLRTSPFGRASAVEAVPATGAGAAVGAGVAGAVIDGAVGRIAHVAGIADALRPVGVLHADAVGRAGRVLAEAA